MKANLILYGVTPYSIRNCIAFKETSLYIPPTLSQEKFFSKQKNRVFGRGAENNSRLWVGKNFYEELRISVMPNYEVYLMRHSEHMVMWLIEEAERANGIKYRDFPPLEERWNVAFGNGGGNDFTGAPAMRLAA